MKYCFLLLFFLSWICFGNVPELSSEQAITLCREAEELFHQANEIKRQDPARSMELCRNAAARYEQVLAKSSLQNSKVHYNLGNIYFRMQDTGRAILQYRRALEIDPADQKLLRNLQFARQMRSDQFKEPEKTRMLKTLFFWHYDFSFHTRQTIFLTAYSVAFLLGIIAFRIRRTGLKTALLLAVLLTSLFGTSTLLTLRQLDKSAGVILAKEVIGRMGDGESYAPSFTEPLHAGTEFILLRERNQWAEIQLPDEQTCWIPTKAFELL